MLIDQISIGSRDRFWDAPLKVLLATLLICLLAPIKIDVGGISDIPITLQSLLVLLVPLILGPKLGGMAVALYLVAGAVGLPVFAGGSSGVEKLVGPTAGFLCGFPLAAVLVGLMAQGRWGRSWWGIAASLLSGHVLILLLGFGWLGLQSTFETIPEKVQPLLPGLYLKVIFGTLLMLGLNAIMRMVIRNQDEWGKEVDGSDPPV
ncbi:MAG: biotin transporter BioY [Bacteroidota bacterium]